MSAAHPLGWWPVASVGARRFEARAGPGRLCGGSAPSAGGRPPRPAAGSSGTTPRSAGPTPRPAGGKPRQVTGLSSVRVVAIALRWKSRQMTGLGSVRIVPAPCWWKSGPVAGLSPVRAVTASRRAGRREPVTGKGRSQWRESRSPRASRCRCGRRNGRAGTESTRPQCRPGVPNEAAPGSPESRSPGPDAGSAPGCRMRGMTSAWAARRDCTGGRQERPVHGKGHRSPVVAKSDAPDRAVQVAPARGKAYCGGIACSSGDHRQSLRHCGADQERRSSGSIGAMDSRIFSSPAYQLEGRGQWAITSVKPSSAARPTASVKAATLLSEKTGDESRLR